MLKATKSGKWRLYWGYMPLPANAEALGTIQRETLETGALIRLATGIYVQGNAGAIRTLPQREVEEAIERSSAAATLGRTGGTSTSDAKTEAARLNGKRGGRPRNDRNQQRNKTMSSNYEQLAKQRVNSDDDLGPEKDILLDYEWDNMTEHYIWVATADKAEILSWVLAIRNGENAVA